MNKILSLFCMCALTLQVFAAPTYTAKVKITMSSDNADNKSITLREAAIFSDLYDDGYDSESPNAGGLYVLASDNSHWLKWATNNLEGTKIGLTTGADESYTFTFTGVVGTYMLKDNAPGATSQFTLIVEDGTYVFSAAANSTLDGRFSITKIDKYNVTLNANGLATFSAIDAVSIPDGLTAYKAQYVSKTDYLDLTEITGKKVPANTGVILFGDVNAQYTLDITNEAVDALSDNDLKAASIWSASHEGYDAFVLSGSSLYLYEGTDMKPNKAFLLLPQSAGAPRRIRLTFSQATGVESIAAEGKAVKFIENGRVFIKRGDKVYNLQGQLVK